MAGIGVDEGKIAPNESSVLAEVGGRKVVLTETSEAQLPVGGIGVDLLGLVGEFECRIAEGGGRDEHRRGSEDVSRSDMEVIVYTRSEGYGSTCSTTLPSRSLAREKGSLNRVIG